MIGRRPAVGGTRVPPQGRGGVMKVLVGKRIGFAAVLAALLVGVILSAALPASAVQPPAAADPAVITHWNAISVNTIAGPAPFGAGLNNAEGIMWFAFAQAAV